MKFLLIGASGYIGKSLTSQLVEAGHEVVCSQRKAVTSEWFLDLRQGFCDKTFEKINVDVVCVLAAMTGIKQCEQEPELANKINVEATCQLIKFFHDKGCFIIYLSTNHVFANQTGSFESTTQQNPRSHYGKTKACVESYIAQQQINAAIVRPTKVIGANYPLFDSWLLNWQQGQTVTVFTDHYIAPVSLKHLTSFLMLLSLKKIKGTFHCSGEKAISYAILAKTLLKTFALDAKKYSMQCNVLLENLLTYKQASNLGVTADVASVLSTNGQFFAYPADTLNDVLTEYIRGKFD